MVSGDPFQYTIEEAEKSVPVATMVNELPPTTADAGEIEVRTGMGAVSANAMLPARKNPKENAATKNTVL